jgi:hypothetical protein
MRVLALIVLVAGFLLVWLAWPLDPDLEEVCPPIPEGQVSTIEPSWWPPGGSRCTVEDGASKTTYPWREYVTVVLFAVAVAVLRPRPLRVLASLGLVLAALTVFFVGW